MGNVCGFTEMLSYSKAETRPSRGAPLATLGRIAPRGFINICQKILISTFRNRKKDTLCQGCEQPRCITDVDRRAFRLCALRTDPCWGGCEAALHFAAQGLRCFATCRRPL